MTPSNKTSALWGGRFASGPDALAAKYGASVAVDQRLAHHDIRLSLAHAEMLHYVGILSTDEHTAIDRGLREIEAEVEAGTFVFREEYEDVHMNIEVALTERIGTAGGKLHTARSRNDQVATSLRLWVRDACSETQEGIAHLLAVLCDLAAGHLDVVMPGYTHLQRAQPVRLAHHFLAWAEMLRRDLGRISDAQTRLNESPLGAAALAGTTFPIDRHRTAEALGFSRPMRNSLDAVSDRDFLVEVLAALTNLAIHLSRISEELVIWSTQEFRFVTMSDAFTTGSSIMPQKKNPDMAELARGKTGRVVGSLVNLIVILKGLPLAYNRDLQEDKLPTFEAFDSIHATLAVLAEALRSATFHEAAMRAALVHGFVDATEVADWLAARGLPFREAHHVAGRLVARASASGRTLGELPLEEFQAEHASFDATIFEALQPEVAIERRTAFGGPARAQVESAIAELRNFLK